MILLQAVDSITAPAASTSTDWGAISAIATVAAAVIAFFYTIFTFNLLRTTNRSLKLTERSLTATEKSLEAANNTIELNKQAMEQSNKITEFQIYMEIAKQLNIDKAEELSAACSRDKLCIDGNFQGPPDATNVSGNDFNRYILNPLEDLAKFWEDKLITTKSVDEGFGYFVLSVGNCSETIKHIKKLRETHPSCYLGFEKLYSAIRERCSPIEQATYRPNFN